MENIKQQVKIQKEDTWFSKFDATSQQREKNIITILFNFKK